MAAKMDKEEDGSPFVRLQIAITDPVAAQKVLDKRYLTGSVGGRAGKAICSISGEDLASESVGRPVAPKYKRGQVYKGKLSYIDMQDISFKEYSFVNQPADGKSSVRSTSVISNKDGKPNSEGWVAKSTAFVLHMNEEDIYSLEEHESVLKNMKKKESKPLYLQLKGSFLSAMAIQESENYNKTNDSLLSIENDDQDSYQENSNMKDKVEQDDVLAAVEGLSQDLSAIASQAIEESDKIQESDASAAAAVQKVVNEMVVLGMAAQRAHWNVMGENFEQYHALFGAIYTDVFESLDSVAEEIRKMGVFVDNLTNMVMNSSFKDDSSATDPESLIESLLEKNMALNASILEAFTIANENNAQGTADVLATRDGMHKKWSWQLKASISEEAGEPADESWRILPGSEVSESDEEPETSTEENPSADAEVDSDDTEKKEEDTKAEESEAELTDEQVVSEQNADDTNKKLQSLEDENQKLKAALHRTLVERVVDAKISAGLESADERETLIEEHANRSATSLADSLRDVAKLPMVKSSRTSSPEIDFEINAVEGENNVLTIDQEEEEVVEQKESFSEQLFVDALMGRRKL
jgi:starvation-inducible DNA-binding protein